MNQQLIQCRLCKSGYIKNVVNIECENHTYGLVYCRNCELLQFVEQYFMLSPDYDRLKSVDINNNRIWCQGQHKFVAYSKWHKKLEKYHIHDRREQKLLDIGCGTGGFLNYIKNQNYGLYGFDVSKAQSDYARQAFPNVRQAQSCSQYLNECNSKNMMFDVVTMWDVLEHIRNPLEFMADVRKVIRPGGLLYISTPNGLAKLTKYRFYKLFPKEVDLCGEFMPWEHVFYYSRTSLNYLLDISGFKLLNAGTVPCYRRPLSIHEIVRRGLFLSTMILPSKAFQIDAWAYAQE